jgi:hypothetical protein
MEKGSGHRFGGCLASPKHAHPSDYKLRSQLRLSCRRKTPAEGREPRQFRTRNNPNEPQQTRSKPNLNAAKSTILIDIPPLITVWLQVRVLPGPPTDQWLSRFSFHSLVATTPEIPRFAAQVGASSVRKLLLQLRSDYDLSTRS